MDIATIIAAMGFCGWWVILAPPSMLVIGIILGMHCKKQ